MESGPPAASACAAGGPLARSPARGFELLQEGGAGGGSFLVMRLRGGASRASSD